MSYNIRKLDHGILVEAKNQHWTDEDCNKLRDEGIIFNKGVSATKITPRKNNNPLITIGIEDDGFIEFHENDLTIDAYWLEDMIKVLQDTLNYVNKGEN